ncbi:hypothetical protein CLIM01_02762 [Colletotrichum limetticola]|uniref:DUF7707 domain-containing protein n=1 Tax=Colletotrichum limetticola TaxID=1209924 RepID=A0ABQ9Q7V9_9PEZI|nr:hypothetical protein CLIM01_02762 [Colletotrichum limetticola]
MRTSLAIVALSALTAVSAQRKVYTAADINVATVSVNQRASWCVAERNTCKVLCEPNPTTNDCDSTTLVYSCLCPNGSAPGLEYYEQTMPTFICEKAFEDSITANVGDARGQTNCTDTIKSQCGTINAQADQASGVSTTTTASATSTPTGTNTAATTPAASSSSSSAWAVPTANPAHVGNAAATVVNCEPRLLRAAT